MRRAADGSFHFVDRRKNVIRRSGENISAVEVESVLLSHPAVADAAVVGVEDNVYGAVVQAYLVLEADAAPDDDEEAATMAALREYIRTRLGPRHRPRDLFVVDTLPRTETGKLRRRALVDPEAAEDPEWT